MLDERFDFFIHLIEGIYRTVVRTSMKLRTLNFINGLLGQTCIRNRGGFQHMRSHHLFAEELPQKGDHLLLWTVIRLVTVD